MQANCDRLPDVCPICLHSAHPLQIADGYLCPDAKVPARKVLQIAYRCPRDQCSALFIAEYAYSATSTGNKCTFSKLMPQTPRRGEFDQALAKLSPSFIKIHDQALAADTYGLGEIAGVGLRKALEFLVKDYCIRKYPDQADEIKKTFFGTRIKKFVTDPNVSKCAERAAWLGNDETHYLKVWSQHDLEDLKRLIKLTVNWISNELLTEQYFSEMPAQ